jgi:predicted N-formylglutamate amidohydrolase
VTGSLILTCEHAVCAVPPEVELEVGPDVLRSHHGWDSGAAALARSLAGLLGAPLLEGEVSRLVVDLNRREEGAGVTPSLSFGLPIPGNVGLAAVERERRLERYHRPYRRRVHELAGAQPPCLHLSVHSFDPSLDAARADLEVGILFDPDRQPEAAVAGRLVDGLQDEGWEARPNQPYLGVADGLTTWLRERLSPGCYSGIEVEASQSLGPAELEGLATDLARILRALAAADHGSGHTSSRTAS